MKLFDKVKSGDVKIEEAIDCVMGAVTETLVTLLSEDESEELFPQIMEAMPTIMSVMSCFIDKKLFIRLKGLETPKTFELKLGLPPRLIDLTTATDDEVKGLPGVEIDVDIIPPILEGKVVSVIHDGNILNALDIISGKVKYCELPTVFEWTEELDGALEKSDYEALLSLADKDLGVKLLKQFIPVLDTALEKLGA